MRTEGKDAKDWKIDRLRRDLMLAQEILDLLFYFEPALEKYREAPLHFPSDSWEWWKLDSMREARDFKEAEKNAKNYNEPVVKE